MSIRRNCALTRATPAGQRVCRCSRLRPARGRGVGRQQALAVYEFLHELRKRVWDRYGEQITERMRFEYEKQQNEGVRC